MNGKKHQYNMQWQLAIGCSLTLLSMGCNRAAELVGDAPNSEASVVMEYDYEKDVLPVFARYCYDCHGDDMDKGGVALDTYPSHAELVADKKTWLMVRENLVTRLMPPAEKPQPTSEELAIMKAWLDREVFQLDPAHPDPGRVTIRRLNRQEYNNTIRDMVGVDFQPAQDFPQDNTGYGFDNIGDVLSLSPLLLEKYLDAAEEVIDMALVKSPSPTRMEKLDSSTFDGGHMSGPATRVLSTEGAMHVYHEFPEAGEYMVVIKAFGDQAGDEPVEMEVDVMSDGWPSKEFKVQAEKDRPDLYEYRVKENTPGRRKIEIEFTNDYYTAKKGERPAQDRNLYVEYVAIEGPLADKEFEVPESHRRIYVVEPQSEDDYDAVRRILENFALRAYRRPPADGEIEKLVELVRLARREGDTLDVGIRIALQAVLVSPQFLFRGELQDQPDNPKEIVPVTEYDLASRLSYFIWSSAPDDILMDLASRGGLRANLRTQVKRMLDDPRSYALAENFAGQWLSLRKLESVMPDREVFRSWNDGLREAMIQETRLFFTSIQREDRDLMNFINADYTFVNEQLAKHYDIPGVAGPYFQRVRLDTSKRGGILSHASVLTLTSNPTRTSPVKRGSWVLDKILGTPPPPPPPTVPPIEDSEIAGRKLTFREMLEMHAEQPGCSSCHKRMDPLGLGLEGFDGIGAWRTKEEGVTLDLSGKLISGQTFSGFAELRDILSREQADLFIRCVTKMMMTYAYGRGLEVFDEPEVERAVAHIMDNGNRFSELIWAVVDSAGFQMRRGDPKGRSLANEDKLQ